MASNDWTALTNVLSSGDVARGVSRGVTKPNGGGNFCYIMNALTNTVGIVALYATPQAPNTNFNPLLLGGDIRGAIQRGVCNGTAGYDAWLFMALQGNDISDHGYLLGLSDGDPSHIELRKGIASVGLPDEAPGGANTILARGTATFVPGTWVHLRLEAVVNTGGDVVINCYQNDLNAHAVTSPVWTAIPGISQFIDDLAGVNSGSLPYVGGRCGFGGRFTDTTRRVYVDQLEVIKQT